LNEILINNAKPISLMDKKKIMAIALLAFPLITAILFIVSNLTQNSVSIIPAVITLIFVICIPFIIIASIIAIFSFYRNDEAGLLAYPVIGFIINIILIIVMYININNSMKSWIV